MKLDRMEGAAGGVGRDDAPEGAGSEDKDILPRCDRGVHKLLLCRQAADDAQWLGPDVFIAFSASGTWLDPVPHIDRSASYLKERPRYRYRRASRQNMAHGPHGAVPALPMRNVEICADWRVLRPLPTS